MASPCCYHFIGEIMLNEPTHQKLIAMKLFGMAHAVKERLARVDHQSLSATELLGLIVDDEWLYRENRKLTAHQCVLITGPAGAGKSYLAQALAEHACRAGFSVQYLRLPTLLAQFVQARAQGTYANLLKRL